MRRLQAEGLLRFVPHQGAFVTAWNEADAEEIFELRALLESHAARLAADRATAADLARMRQTAEAQHQEVQAKKRGYLERVTDLNTEFHRRLQEAAGSERLRAMLTSLADAPLVYQTFRDYSDEDLRRSARHHLEIVEALESRDGTWAASVMRSHVLAARRSFNTRHAEAAAAKSEG